jgi:hypothetical protein
VTEILHLFQTNKNVHNYSGYQVKGRKITQSDGKWTVLGCISEERYRIFAISGLNLDTCTREEACEFWRIFEL